MQRFHLSNAILRPPFLHSFFHETNAAQHVRCFAVVQLNLAINFVDKMSKLTIGFCQYVVTAQFGGKV